MSCLPPKSPSEPCAAVTKGPPWARGDRPREMRTPSSCQAWAFPHFALGSCCPSVAPRPPTLGWDAPLSALKILRFFSLSLTLHIESIHDQNLSGTLLLLSTGAASAEHPPPLSFSSCPLAPASTWPSPPSVPTMQGTCTVGTPALSLTHVSVHMHVRAGLRDLLCSAERHTHLPANGRQQLSCPEY